MQFAKIKFYSPENGGRLNLPFGSGYSPYAIIPNENFRYAVILHDISDLVIYEEEFIAIIEYRYNTIDYTKLDLADFFHLMEGKRLVGIASIIK